MCTICKHFATSSLLGVRMTLSLLLLSFGWLTARVAWEKFTVHVWYMRNVCTNITSCLRYRCVTCFASFLTSLSSSTPVSRRKKSTKSGKKVERIRRIRGRKGGTRGTTGTCTWMRIRSRSSRSVGDTRFPENATRSKYTSPEYPYTHTHSPYNASVRCHKKPCSKTNLIAACKEAQRGDRGIWRVSDATRRGNIPPRYSTTLSEEAHGGGKKEVGKKRYVRSKKKGQDARDMREILS